MKTKTHQILRSVLIVVSVFLVSLLISYYPVLAAKEGYVYYTYGGFNAVYDAWHRLALIFSDPEFQGLIGLSVLIGVIVLYFVVIARATIAGAAKFDLAAWAIPVMIGAVFYLAFIKPKDKIVIHDVVLNKFAVVDGVPKVMVIMADAVSSLERTMIEIVSRSASLDITDYRKNAGGVGFMILSRLGDPVAVSFAATPTYVQLTAYQFIKDCLLFEIERPGSTLTAQELASGKVNYAEAIRRAMNPSIPTIYYDEDGKEVDERNGRPVSCYESGEKLLNYIEKHKRDIILATCVLSGYNIDVPEEQNICISLLEKTFTQGIASVVNRGGGGGGNLSLLSGQAFLAGALIQTLNSINPEASIKLMATREAASQYIGLTIHANAWLPVIRETLRAVAIAISPFVLLFAATPLVGRALGFLLGMMVWVITWSVIDAILHYSAVSQAMAASNEFAKAITDGTPGFMFFVLLPSYAAKVAAVFGAIRWAGLGLATVLTTILIKFGGAALALVAGAVTGTVQSAGAAMGRMVTDITSPIKADLVPTAAWTNAAAAAGGLAPLASGLIAHQAGTLRGQADAGRYLGADKIALSTALSTIESTSRNIQLGTPEIAEASGRIAGLRQRSFVEEILRLQRIRGANLPILMGMVQAWQEAGGAIGTMILQQKHGIPGEEIYITRAQGANFSFYGYQDDLVRVIRTSRGDLVDSVNTKLLSATFKDLKTKSFEELYRKVQQGLEKMSISELEKFYNEHKHMFSKEQRDAIEELIRKSKEESTTSKKVDQTEQHKERYTNKALTTGLKGEIGVQALGLGIKGEMSIQRQEGIKEGRSEKKAEINERAQTEALVNAIANAITEAIAKQDSQTTGKVFERIFKEDLERQKAMEAAELYRSAQTLETAITFDVLPLVVQRIGDKFYSQYDTMGLGNRYSQAVSDLIQAIHSGDIDKIKKYTEEIKRLQEEWRQQGIIWNPENQGQKLQEEVTNWLKSPPFETLQPESKPKPGAPKMKPKSG
jgi:hypothetical protein